MEEGEQEEGSSSQNVNITVVEIKERGAFIGITLSNGSSFFIFPEDFSSLELARGEKIPCESLKKIELLNNTSLAYKKAISILSFAPSTAFLLNQKLLRKGFDSISINKALERLSEKKLIDDKKFAAAWVSARLSRNPESPFLLKAALAKKGVDRETAEEVLKDFTPDSSLYIESFEKALAKQLRKSNRPTEKIKISLLRKGYPLSLINKYISKV